MLNANSVDPDQIWANTACFDLILGRLAVMT